jgi:hypothetical protein
MEFIPKQKNKNENPAATDTVKNVENNQENASITKTNQLQTNNDKGGNSNNQPSLNQN